MMVLCLAMLSGTTFAWFVENKESGTNTIYAGNLDVRLWYKTELDESAPDAGWMVLDETSELFEGVWAPGTVKPLYLKIENCGDVAFNLRLSLEREEEQGSVNLADESFTLSGYIEGATSFGNNVNALSQGLANTDRLSKFTDELSNLIFDGANYYKPVLYKNDVYYGKIVLSMPSNIQENATNYAANAPVPTLKLGLTAVATQIELVNDDFSTVGVDGNN